MKVVRRARKSLRERRMKACINDLNANLSKVEMRVFKQQKQDRAERRRLHGHATERVPADVLMGKMNPELYDIECRLHREAGLPPPPPPPELVTGGLQRPQGSGTAGATQMMIGFVPFATIVRAVRALPGPP